MAQITVTGTATRIFFNGKGVQIAEPFKTQTGEVKTRKYTAWFTQPVDFREGAFGTFTGSHSAKIEKWVDADGNPKLDQTGQPGQSVVVALNDTVFVADQTVPNTPAWSEAKVVANAADLALDAPF